MKTIFTIVGVLTLAQWVFVGLLHGFLIMNGKNSPETFNKLHDVPVIGGYFPAVEMPTEEDKEREYADEMRLRFLEAKRDHELPEAFNPESFQELLSDLQAKRSSLDDERKAMDSRESEIQSLIDELRQRESTVQENQTKLDKKARDVALATRELELLERTVGQERDEGIIASQKRLAKMLESMKPELARDLLVGKVENTVMTEADIEARFTDAAQVLSHAPAEVAAAIIEKFKPVEFVRLQQIMKELPAN